MEDQDRIDALRDAQEKIMEAVAEIRTAVKDTEHEDWTDAYITHHLSDIAEGGRFGQSVEGLIEMVGGTAGEEDE